MMRSPAAPAPPPMPALAPVLSPLVLWPPLSPPVAVEAVVGGVSAAGCVIVEVTVSVVRAFFADVIVDV